MNNIDVYNIRRDDPFLVQVIEELGSTKASGKFDKLKIEEIEVGTFYRIDEYHGYESVKTQQDYSWDVA